jgi:class 3 adenylate cyclase/ketosteroid isomerase-like protein
MTTMQCTSCGRTNRAGARFCGGCGAPLTARCSACGAASEPGAQFCDACGAALADRSTDKAIARKIVTIVFADLIGSVALHERLDAESARRFMDRYHRAMSAAVELHGGTVVQLLGDGVLAAFGVPRVAEDDALRAVRAAVGMQRAFRELAREQSAAAQGVGLRVAVNTGEVVVSDDQTSVIGDTTNVAARLQQEAHDGDVLVGEATERLVGALVTLVPLGAFALRGRAGAVTAYRVASLDRPPSAHTTAFVGRDEELRRLGAVYDAAVAAPAARLAVLLGSPGLGKSRLVDEFGRRVAERATVLRARCDAAGGSTFAPVADALRSFLRIEAGAGGDALRAAIDSIVASDDADRSRITAGIAALLAGTPAAPEETFFVVRRLLAAIAAVRPVVLAIDDLHWAEPLLLDLVEHLVQWSAGVPLLVLAAARPELRDARGSLAAPGPLVADLVTLAGLDASAATRLAANVIGGAELPAALAGRVLATSEGNPLFVGELVRMLVQEGTLRREGDRWVTSVEVAKLDMPPTIQVLLAARIERLRPEERAVLERAAVIGRQFSRAAVAHLLAREAADLDARLETLRRSELIEPDTGWFLGEPALRFHHVLIRDAAYRRVLKETRAELHERVADWVAARAGDAVEHEETIGRHLEQAHRHLLELGAPGDHGRTLGERAARHLGATGRRALARDDLALAASSLERAIDCLAPDDAARADLALDWCEALLAAGEVAASARAIDELGRFAADSDRLRAWHVCFAGQRVALTEPDALRAAAGSVAAAARTLADCGDAAGEAKAHAVHAVALARLGEIGPCEAALDQALAAARRARDRRRANAVLAGAPVAALWGPSPVTRASGRCLDVVRVLRITQGAPAVEAVALRCQAVLEALRGRGDAARRMITSARRMVEELGIAAQVLEADVFAGLIELLEGDPEAAERSLRAAHAGLRERGLGIDAARAAALLGRALLAMGRAAEAEALSHESEALAGDDLKAGIAWRGVRAEALARRGEHAAAIELARAAVEIAAATDALLDHADARMALATVLRAAGRAAEADAEELRAIEIWEAKGATLLAGRARPTPASHSAPERALAGAAQHPTRRVRANAVTAPVQRVEAMGTAGRFANAACRIAARHDRDWEARDWEAVRASYAPSLCLEDRRSVVRLSMAGADFFASLRLMFDTPASRWERERLATRGERLALFAVRFTGDAGGGDPFVFAALALMEIGADGRYVGLTLFDSHDRAAAWDELDARFEELSRAPGPDFAFEDAVGAAPHPGVAAGMREFSRAFTARDWTALAARCASNLVVQDHRRLGWETLRGPEAYLAALRTLVELAPDTELRLDHAELCARGYLVVTVWVGTREGGAFEEPSLMVAELDGAGRIARFDQYEMGALDEARVRFAAVAAAGSLRVPPNAAARASDEQHRLFALGDWDALAAFCDPAFEFDDRRRHTLTHGGVDMFLTSGRLTFDGGATRAERTLLATAGDRLALEEVRWIGSSTAVAESADFEAEALVITEVDEAGRLRASVLIDPGDRRSASVEMLERYMRGEGASRMPPEQIAFLRAMHARDLGAMRAALPDDFSFVDHRRIGLGLVGNADDYLASLAAVFEQSGEMATDVLYHVAAAKHGSLNVGRMFGTLRDGGEFESRFVRLNRYDGGRLVGVELYELEDLDRARARFDELARGAHDLLRIPPNAATRALDRWAARAAAQDWAGLEAVFAPDMTWEDRRPLVRDGGDRAKMLASVRLAASAGVARYGEVTPLATYGDRLALTHLRFSDAAHSFEIEILQVDEVDAEGRIVASITFAPEDRRAAGEELMQRFARNDDLPWRAELWRAVRTRDLTALRAHVPDGFLFDDHRRVGAGRIEGADAYVAWLAALFERSPDALIEPLYFLASGPHGRLAVAHTFGTLADGGAFESVFLQLTSATGADLYDLEDLDRARARLDELAAGPSASRFANAASRAMDRLHEAWSARSLERIAERLAPEFRYVDRRPLLAMELDRGEFLANFGPFLTRMSNMEVVGELLATRGERSSLHRLRHDFTLGDFGPTEMGFLQIAVVDAEGRITNTAVFEPNDLDAAYAELDAGYAAGEAAPYAGLWETSQRRARARAAGDWEQLASLLPADLVTEDHRLIGWGTLRSRDENLAMSRALVDLAPDVVPYLDHVLGFDDRGALIVLRWGGSWAGGAFEKPTVIVNVHGPGGRLQCIHLYDLEQLDAARACYDALRSASPASHIETAATLDARDAAGKAASRPIDPLAALAKPNRATAAADRVQAAFDAGDWSALRALASTRFVFDDRRRQSLVRGDVDPWIANMQGMRAKGSRSDRTLVATAGDRVALEHVVQRGAPDTGRFEIEFLLLTAIDADGRLLASITFDPADRAAAFEEAGEWWVAGEAAGLRGLATIARFRRAFDAHDLDAFRECLAPEAVLHEHRTLGFVPRDREAWMEWTRQFVELAPDVRAEVIAIPAMGPCGTLSLVRVVGTQRDGGPFEYVFAGVFETAGDRIVRYDFFDIGDLDGAQARYAEIEAGRSGV